MVITKIEIRNVKGITDLVIDQIIQPNRPNILVAPNGFGKSSIAIAFDSLVGAKLELRPEVEPSPKNGDPYLSIDLSTGVQLIADKSTNTIKDNFDVHVATNPLIPKAKAQRFGRAITAKASMDIKPTTLIKTVPKRVTFEYNLSLLKQEFGASGKILINISKVYQNQAFLNKCEQSIDFHKFELQKYSLSIKSAIDIVNSFSEHRTGDIKTLISENSVFEHFIPEFYQLSEFIKEELDCSDVDAFLSAWQFICVRRQMERRYRLALQYADYRWRKQEIDKTLQQINPFPHRFQISSKESDKSLIIEWPKAHLISGGQRDILVFIASLIECGFRTDKNCILVVDEFFDYLDDANIVVFQYYVSTLIETFRKNKRLIFPILLTHLDPNYLKHFCFNDKRLNVVYLKDTKAKISDKMIKLVANREDSSIKDDFNKHYFHYSVDIDNVNLEKQFMALGLNKDWATPASFIKKIDRECRKYLLQPDERYDPLAVCFSVRRRVEEQAYSNLEERHRAEFLEIHGTTEKLSFAHSRGALIPETYFLLGLIYNHPLHMSGNDDISKPLSMKLDNPSIKIMIRSLWPE